MSDILDLDFSSPPPTPPSGNADRFGGRWRLVGAGLSNVWRYGDLDLPAASGRLLLRGPNGTGKTTALEALWPYLLDLNAAKLAAGKARPTTLKLLMSDGAPAKGRRYGYLWISFAAPAAEAAATALDEETSEDEVVSYGVRLQYSPSSTPAVKVVPFTVPGRPLKELALRAPNGAALEHEEFSTRVEAAGGQVFPDPDDYVEHLAARIWSTTSSELRDLASRLREVRNPTLLGDVSPAAAADALRQSLPGVAGDVLAATADALAESDTTREAFERDEHAATVLAEFARAWTGHVVDVTRSAYTAAREAANDAGLHRREVQRCTSLLTDAQRAAEEAAGEVQRLDTDHRTAVAAARAIEISEAYRAHGDVTDLRARLKAEQAAAVSSFAILDTAAAHARTQTEVGQEALDEITTDLAALAADAESAGTPSHALDVLLSHHPRARVTRTVADRVIDPGPGITLTQDRPGLQQLAATWKTFAQGHCGAADKAALVLRDHEPVAEAETTYDGASQAASRATAVARTVASRTLAAVARWAPEHPHLRGLHNDPAFSTDEHQLWEADDIDVLAHAEPTAVRDQLNVWAEQVVRIGEALAAVHESTAKDHLASAADLDATAAQHRADARRLRSGQLLPLPRPNWAGPGDDDIALGTLLEWRHGLDHTDDQLALLELALASAGVLGAHVHTGGASTNAWHIGPVGNPTEKNLTAVLDVDPSHPQADLARAVLARIALADTATGPRDTAALLIGRDGTFAAGPLSAHPAAALSAAGTEIPAASHIGARTRLAKARAKADELDATADELQHRAEHQRSAAEGCRQQRNKVRSEAKSFPPRDELANAEAERARTVTAAHELEAAARILRQQADNLAADHTALHTAWAARARDMGMPIDHDELATLIENSRDHAKKLTTCAQQVTDRLLPKLDRALRLLPDETELTTRLADLQHAAQTAHTTVLETQAELTELQSHGDADDAARRFDIATAQATQLSAQLDSAREKTTVAEKHLSTCESELNTARGRLTDVRPRQTSTEAHLATLLAWDPIAQALDVDTFLSTRGGLPDDGLGSAEQLLDTVKELIARRPTASKKTLGERCDEVRAELAQTWTIARDDPPAGLDELDTFVLTHAETHYEPISAAARAQTLAAKAKSALDAAEAAALRDFVIGRLPAAIGTAWTALTDWKKSVNEKMRAAQASSGVGVQVHVGLRDDLDVATRTVYELSCQVSDAVRTEEQKEQVGQALQSLLAAADGSTMAERLAAAVDIRDWVEVHYLVERPGPDGAPVTRRWGSRTGLSGGERRLVVLGGVSSCDQSAGSAPAAGRVPVDRHA
ncbi:hypothetical protein [Streptomyces sp. NPDC051776]|uniref:hypothetical protein n=1 Tax=Streptomyces sp. NPDC051776 TaxID=3155414 RepID=UPI00342AEDD1